MAKRIAAFSSPSHIGGLGYSERYGMLSVTEASLPDTRYWAPIPHRASGGFTPPPGSGDGSAHYLCLDVRQISSWCSRWVCFLRCCVASVSLCIGALGLFPGVAAMRLLTIS